MSALHGAVQHISGYDPRCIEVALDGDAYGVKVMEQLGELEAIVRDLAAAGATFMQVRERAKAWVSAHPVSGDQP